MRSPLLPLLLVALLCVSLVVHTFASSSLLRGNDDADPAVGSFIQLTDLHISLDYLPGSSPICDMPECCIQYNASIAEKADTIGDYRCDSNYALLESALSFVRTLKPDFIMWTGDNPSHELWTETRQSVLADLANMTAAFNQYFPDIPVYPVIGNHDSFPVDEMAPPPMWDWLMAPLTNMWGRMIPADQHSNFQHGGYYSALVESGFRVVGINTQWADPLNFYLYVNDTDPAEQLAWLRPTLQAARQAGEKVLIAGHIPMAPWEGDLKPMCMVAYCTKMLDIFIEFSDIIVGQLYGHVHSDYFRVLHNPSNGAPASVMYISPSLTTQTNRNPAVRQFLYDKSTKQILDVKTYIMNLEQAIKTRAVTWTFEYSMRDAYGMNDLSLPSWDAMLTRMKTTNPELFDAFRNYHASLRPNDPCTGECRKRWLCIISTAYPGEFERCYA